MRHILKLASVLALALVALTAGVGQAAEEPDGVVTTAAPTWTWETSVPAAVSVVNNVSSLSRGAVGNCLHADVEAHLCDVKFVEYKGAGERALHVEITFEATSDYDLYVYDPDGNLMDDSAAGMTDGSVSEIVQVKAKPGTYRVEVVKFLAANSVLKGSVTLK